VSDPSEALRKHRHDLGHEDHGAKLAEGTTRGIQILLGLWVALSFCLVVYALVDGSRTAAAPALSEPAADSPVSR
jgi:hypothetical protein